jgi:putative flippase GtrA
MRKLALEIGGYALASGAALAVDMSVLYALTHFARWHYLLAAACAFLAGAAVAYTLSVRFVFQFRGLSNRSAELAAFMALGVAGLLVNEAALFVAISAAGLGLLTAKIVAAGCTFATNFTLRRQLLFAPPKAY